MFLQEFDGLTFVCDALVNNSEQAVAVTSIEVQLPIIPVYHLRAHSAHHRYDLHNGTRLIITSAHTAVATITGLTVVTTEPIRSSSVVEYHEQTSVYGNGAYSPEFEQMEQHFIHTA